MFSRVPDENIKQNRYVTRVKSPGLETCLVLLLIFQGNPLLVNFIILSFSVRRVEKVAINDSANI